ncbi:hypothetical protein CVT24_011185 [Panaeolus cyanescens]|uniref:CFEM domain-containing protein n=1 Tax=Panaeolus cyanescens TaxID=181874 RepID=A0A409YG90_9AGAR|nr:hypothetical protein CVT24_011185 [Panaeolus cyanescens]
MYFKLSTIASLLAAATVGSAQIVIPANWWTQLPSCAQQCALQAAAQTNCPINDIACLCRSPTFYNNFVNCINNNCPLPDIQISKDLVKKLCTQIDWLWGINPCVRDCAIWAASQIPCDINDIACLCRNRELFLSLVRQCVRDRNCPVLSTSTGVVVLPFDVTCPTIGPNPTAIAI